MQSPHRLRCAAPNRETRTFVALNAPAPSSSDSETDTGPASRIELDKALDYAAVAARVQAFAGESQFILVETFAERLAELLMAEFQIPWLRIKLTKPGAVPAASGGVGVEIERGCR
jgi:FolB domain-containing protein